MLSDKSWFSDWKCCQQMAEKVVGVAGDQNKKPSYR